MDMVHEKNRASLDTEFIQSTKDHKCFHKLYILAKDGFTDRELEFYPIGNLKTWISDIKDCFVIEL